MKLIHERDEFREFAREIGVRTDWHEPDEQGISASIEGRSFDNAGFWPAPEMRDSSSREMHVIFYRHEPTEENLNKTVALAAVNLATLCAWASGPDSVGTDWQAVARANKMEGDYWREQAMAHVAELSTLQARIAEDEAGE